MAFYVFFAVLKGFLPGGGEMFKGGSPLAHPDRDFNDLLEVTSDRNGPLVASPEFQLVPQATVWPNTGLTWTLSFPELSNMIGRSCLALKIHRITKVNTRRLCFNSEQIRTNIGH